MKERALFYRIGPLFLFSVLSVLSYHTALWFGFWKDDWIAYWGAKTLSPLFYMYWFHPGSTIQFFIFSLIFPPNSLPWQISGLVLRILASYSVFLMIRSFRTSFRTALIAGLFFAVSPLALDVVGWPTIQVLHMDVIFTCLAITSWNTRRSPVVSIFLTLAAVLCDPFRTIPILGFVFLIVVKNRNLNLRFSRKNLLRSGIVFLILFFVSLFLFSRFGLPRVKETTLYNYVANNGLTYNSFRSKIYVVGNYFNSIHNIVAGSIISVPEQLSTGIYDRIASRLGFTLLIIFCGYSLFLWRRRDPDWFLFLFLLLWLTMFYLPNFLSEPRLTMGATHRYVTIAAVGWVGIAGLLLSRIKPFWLSVFITLVIGSVSMNTSQQRLSEWLPFRSRELLTTVWERVLQDTPNTDEIVVLSFRGDHQILTNTIAYSSISPFTVYRLMKDVHQFPLLAGSDSEALKLFCAVHPVYILGEGTILQEPLPIERLYSWQILQNGSVVTISEKEREQLTLLAKQQGCVVTNELRGTEQ